MGRRAPRAIALLVLLARLATAASVSADEDPLPGPAPQHRAASPAALNRECEGCHQTIAAEWRVSYHRLASRDPAFQRALAREPVAFCRRCHAPEADPQKAAEGWPAENGVACVTCHVLAGQLVSGHGSGKTADSLVHPVRREPRLSTAAACERCHEFQFPDGRWRRRAELMQLTLSEHRASAYGSTPCIDCHMPRVAGQSGGTHRSHAFLGGHDETTVRSALSIQAARRHDAVTLHLTPQQVGHAFPTGDLFRRLVLTVQIDGEPDIPVQTRELMRHFATVQQLPGHPVRVTARDDRLTAPQTFAFPLPAEAATRPVRWRVTYQRVAFPHDQRGGPAVLDGEILLASGALAP